MRLRPGLRVWELHGEVLFVCVDGLWQVAGSRQICWSIGHADPEDLSQDRLLGLKLQDSAPKDGSTEVSSISDIQVGPELRYKDLDYGPPPFEGY